MTEVVTLFLLAATFIAAILPPLAYWIARFATQGHLHEKFSMWRKMTHSMKGESRDAEEEQPSGKGSVREEEGRGA
jgi:hypothetical protein